MEFYYLYDEMFVKVDMGCGVLDLMRGDTVLESTDFVPGRFSSAKKVMELFSLWVELKAKKHYRECEVLDLMFD